MAKPRPPAGWQAVGVVVLVLACQGTAAGKVSSTPAPIRSWVPVASPPTQAPPTVAPTPEVTPTPTPRPTRAPGASYAGHRLTGAASWYCLPGVSACPAVNPAGGPYAAAGPALRAALGQWRGRVVRVDGISVTLNDFCACPERLIDLDAAAFARIAPLSRGLVSVTVTW